MCTTSKLLYPSSSGLRIYSNLWKVICKFLEIFKQRLCPRCLPIYRDKKDSLCICVIKNMVFSKRSKFAFRLVWCLEYSSSARACAHLQLICSHNTRCEKFNFLPLLHNILLFHTSWYKISYDTRAKNIFLTSVITFHRTRSVMYYFWTFDFWNLFRGIFCTTEMILFQFSKFKIAHPNGGREI